MLRTLHVPLSLLAVLVMFTTAIGQSREEKVRADKARVESEGFWIYNDFDTALKQAKETGKPLLVALRCIPCEECVKLDDELVDNHPEIRPLLEKFVCVRVVGTNGLDLDTFQYDTDQSFAMFMLNSDKTVYGRFGTRSHRTDWIGDVSIEGMARALDGALDLHADYPSNKALLEAKRGKPLEFSSPERFPTLSEKYNDSLNYEGDVVKSCIHCHQIGEARRDFYWHQSKPIPEKLLFPYPHPKSIGLILDPQQRATIASVVKGSVADAAKLNKGDRILTMNGQPLLSMADVQWVLHHMPASGGNVQLRVRRGTAFENATIELPSGWRRWDDTSWRVAVWSMRRIALGGMRLEPLDEQGREERGIADGKMALHVLRVGKYGPHGTAMKSGFKEDDIIVGYNGSDSLESEQELFAHTNENCKPGDTVAINLLRNGKKLNLPLRIQE